MVVKLLAAFGAHLQRHRNDLLPATALKFLSGRFLFRFAVIRTFVEAATVRIAFPGPAPFSLQGHVRNFEAFDGAVVEVLLLGLEIV